MYFGWCEVLCQNNLRKKEKKKSNVIQDLQVFRHFLHKIDINVIYTDYRSIKGVKKKRTRCSAHHAGIKRKVP